MHVFTETKSIYKYMHAYYTTTYIIYIYILSRTCPWNYHCLRTQFHSTIDFCHLALRTGQKVASQLNRQCPEQGRFFVQNM